MKNFLLFPLLILMNLGYGQSQPSTLWFGHYQEDRANNPEDPMPGMIYLNIPNDGTFEGELYFSYAGCDGTFDAGRISGTVSDDKIEGSWQGNVDGESVGGKYIGTLNSSKNKYTGTYTNDNGKQGIECGRDEPAYFVAAYGDWYLKGSHEESALNIEVETDPDSDFAEFNWLEINKVSTYRYIIIDRECLLEKMDLKECMVSLGETDWPDMSYGEGDFPSKPLVSENTYVFLLYAISPEGVVIESGIKEFTYN